MSENSPSGNPLEKKPPVYVFRIQTPKRTATIRLEGPFFVLGRGEPYRIFHDDPTLSREHLALVDTPEGYLVKDLGSRNGVLLNGRRLGRYSETLLELGDVLVAGQTKVRLLLQHEAAAEAAAEAGEELTVDAHGNSTAVSALPKGEEDDDLGGEVTGTLDRPELDLEATQLNEDEDEAGLDPQATQIAMDDSDDDLESLPDDAELTLPEDDIEAELGDGDAVESLAAEIDAASTGNAPRTDDEEPASSVELADLAADLGVSQGDLESELDESQAELE